MGVHFFDRKNEGGLAKDHTFSDFFFEPFPYDVHEFDTHVHHDYHDSHDFNAPSISITFPNHHNHHHRQDHMLHHHRYHHHQS